VRIAYVGPVPPHRGGIAQHGSCTVEAFERLGHEVVVESWQSLYPAALFKGELPSVPRRDGRVRFRLRWWNPLGWVLAGRRCRSADLIVFPWVTPFHAVALWVLLRVAGRSAVAFVHNPEPHERMPFTRPLLRMVMRRCEGSVVHAETAAVVMRERTRLERIAVTPHPPNLAIGAEPMPERPPLRLLFLGFVRAYKGADLAIDAVAELRRRGVDVRLTIAGDFWEDPAPMREDLATRMLADVVELRVGYVPDEEIGPILAEHHLVVAPYRSATVSGIAPLAFAAGRPMVVTPVGGLPEAIEHGVNGVVADAVDAVSVADAVLAAADRLDELAAGAAASSSCWEDVASALLAVRA
jgi:glycosyltransferase involved in cell wall biosynthesis